MNTREQFEAAWRKEYPLHSSTAFTRSGFDPERYANTRVQDGWLMWQAARATPADQVCATCNGHGMIGGPSFYAPDEGGEPCPDCATPADHSSIIRMLEGYAESYEMMARQGKDATVRCSSVAVDIRQNMAKWVRDRGTSADHIGDAAEKVDAGSVPVAEMPLTSGAGPQKLAWFKHPDSFAPGTKLYAQPPQPEAQSVRDAEVADLRKLVAELQKALFFWMPSIAGQETSDGERAANDAYLLYGWAAGDEENCYGDRARDAVIEECAAVCDEMANNCADYREQYAVDICCEAIRALKSKPSHTGVKDVWISVATPPKACTEVLVWRADSGPFIAQLVAPCDVPDADNESDDLRWLADAYGWQEGSETPTHWMPMPAPPQKPVSDEVKP